jgi:DNA-directed RNA polymerase subunit RPC12/RpoP
MTIVFDCPRCSSSVQVPDNAVGKTGRCPACQAKLRVPDVPPPPQRMIEFGCPRCSAAIRVPEAAAGKKGRCPGCQAKLLVPDPRAVATVPSPADADGHAEQGLPDLAPEMYAQAMPDLAAAATSALASDTAPPSVRRKKKSGNKAWVLPTLLSAIFFSVAGWWFYKPAESMYAELRYERLEKFNFPAVAMDAELFGMTRANFKRMLKALDNEPVSLRSPTSRIDVVTKQEKVWLELSEGPQGVVYRVDPGQRVALSQWTVKNEDRLTEGRNKELERLSPKFGAALAKQTSGEGSAQEIANYRDTVLLAQMTGGFGFHVVAVVGKNAYRCAYEDSKGRLYFLLPAATRTFTLRGRAIGDKSPILSGDIIVTAPKKKPNLPGVEEGLEVVREPDADKKPDDETEPPMHEETKEKSESPTEEMPGETTEPMTDAKMSESTSE